MKVTLTSIKYFASLSEETPCYSALLWVDGVKVGEVSNRGHGGCDEAHFGWAKYAELNARAKAELPSEEYMGMTLEASLEAECHERLYEYLALRDMRKLLKKKIVFRKGNKGPLYTIGLAAGVDKVQSMHPEALVLNSLPEADAVRIFRAATQ